VFSREQIRRARINAAEDAAQNAACPVYGIAGTKGLPIGSGFLLRVEEEIFFITAAHVLHERHACTLHVPGATEAIPLEGKAYWTGARRPSKTPDFEHDLAFLALTPELSGAISGTSVLTPADIFVNHRSDRGVLYGFVGFPEDENQPLPDNKFLRKSVYFGCQPAQQTAYDWLRYDPRTHFVADFDYQQLVERGGEVVAGPRATGISGGPAWTLGRIKDVMFGVSRPSVIGVTIEWWQEKRWLVALRAAIFIEAIKHFYPHLAPRLPESEYMGRRSAG
jgi:hypothetical protein